VKRSSETLAIGFHAFEHADVTAIERAGSDFCWAGVEDNDAVFSRARIG
jgi:hypothetical protein